MIQHRLGLVMKSLDDLSEEQREKIVEVRSWTVDRLATAIPNSQLQTLMVISGSLMMGVFIFMILPLVISFGGQSSGSEDSFLHSVDIRVLAGFVALVTFTGFFGGHFLYRIQFNLRKVLLRIAGGVSSSGQRHSVTDPVAVAVEFFLKAHILRMALGQGPSFLGLAVVFLAKQSGLLVADSSWWLFAVPAALFLLYSMTIFPTRRRLTQAIEGLFREDADSL